MRCKDIIETIEESCPVSAALDFDHVGFQAGREDKEVDAVYLALDATDAVIDMALSLKADMLITHHPLIFNPLTRVTGTDFVGRRVMKLIQNDISYYAMHTNYDVMRMADLAANIMGLISPEVLDVTMPEQSGNPQRGIGKVGYLKSRITLRECCEYVKGRLKLDSVTVYGDPDRSIGRLAISPGAGRSEIPCAIEKGADVLVTGDIGHHAGIDALAQGLCIIDAGHYGTEYIFMDDMKRFMEEKFPEIKVYTAPICPPSRVV